VLSPYGLEINDNCLSCKTRQGRIVCNLDQAGLQAFETIKYTTAYPKGAVLFLEGQAPRGIFVVCKGQVKLSLGDRTGKTLILKIVDAGEVLGLGATFSGKPYESTAETITPCQISFAKREEFLRFLKSNSDACFKVAEQLSIKYKDACHEVRSLGLSYSAGQKLARLLLEWTSHNGEAAKSQPSLKMTLTHDEIAQMIGTSRETVTRVFADFRKHNLVQSRGSTLLICNKGQLQALAGER